MMPVGDKIIYTENTEGGGGGGGGSFVWVGLCELTAASFKNSLVWNSRLVIYILLF